MWIINNENISIFIHKKIIISPCICIYDVQDLIKKDGKTFKIINKTLLHKFSNKILRVLVGKCDISYIDFIVEYLETVNKTTNIIAIITKSSSAFYKPLIENFNILIYILSYNLAFIEFINDDLNTINYANITNKRVIESFVDKIYQRDFFMFAKNYIENIKTKLPYVFCFIIDDRISDYIYVHNIHLFYNNLVKQLTFMTINAFLAEDEKQFINIKEKLKLHKTIFKIAEYKGDNQVFDSLSEQLNSCKNTFLILIYGFPRSGKTTLSNLIKKNYDNKKYDMLSCRAVNIIKNVKIDNIQKTGSAFFKSLRNDMDTIIDGIKEETITQIIKQFKDENIKIFTIYIDIDINTAFYNNYITCMKQTNLKLYTYSDYIKYNSTCFKKYIDNIYRPEFDTNNDKYKILIQ